jgi:ABC-type Fe3+-siderophore transport system permease subunit
VGSFRPSARLEPWNPAAGFPPIFRRGIIPDVSYQPAMDDPNSTQPRAVLEAGRLWTGGVATAIVAALIAVLAVLLVRGVLKVPLLAPDEAGTLGDASTIVLALLAALGALAATGLMHVLLLTTPRPWQFFNAIVALVTLIVAVLPFLTSAARTSKVATAIIVIFIGATIGALLNGVARSAVRTGRAPNRPTGY